MLEFRLLRGRVISLFQDGSFSIDGTECDGEVYTGVEDCLSGDSLPPLSSDDDLKDALEFGFSEEL